MSVDKTRGAKGAMTVKKQRHALPSEAQRRPSGGLGACLGTTAPSATFIRLNNTSSRCKKRGARCVPAIPNRRSHRAPLPPGPHRVNERSLEKMANPAKGTRSRRRRPHCLRALHKYHTGPPVQPAETAAAVVSRAKVARHRFRHIDERRAQRFVGYFDEGFGEAKRLPVERD